jgi:hypothetical protein
MKSEQNTELLISLLQEGAKKYQINQNVESIDTQGLNDLLEIAMDIIGESNRSDISSLSKSKKVHLVRQVMVFM